MDRIESYIDDNKQRYTDELFALLRIPSISAKSEHAGDMAKAADWVKDNLAAIGMESRVIATPGHPLVYGEWLGKPGAPTVLFYGHYDVQPAEPLELWETPPFEPTVRNGNVHARGSADDKGQFLANMKAVESYFKTDGQPPVNVKFIIEGEEEVTSHNLEKFVADNTDLLACDQIIVSDSAQFAQDVPAVCYGLRGICFMEVFLRGPRMDLHSGEYGGSVVNPGNVLGRLIASLLDPKSGKVAIPGFYDDVVPLSDEERREFAALPFDEMRYLEHLGVKDMPGEEGYTPLERVWARPTCDVNGITSGYQGEGAKTIIPGEASAKISMRLVPDMDPATVEQQFEDYIRSQLPKSITARFETHGTAKPVVVPTDSPALKSARKAIEKGFGAKSVLMRGGGSIPVVETFREHLGVAALLVGYGLPDDNLHSPNEKFSLDCYHRGIKTAAYLLQELGDG